MQKLFDIFTAEGYHVCMKHFAFYAYYYFAAVKKGEFCFMHR